MLVIRVIYARWRSLIMQRTGDAAIEQSENLQLNLISKVYFC